MINIMAPKIVVFDIVEHINQYDLFYTSGIQHHRKDCKLPMIMRAFIRDVIGYIWDRYFQSSRLLYEVSDTNVN